MKTGKFITTKKTEIRVNGETVDMIADVGRWFKEDGTFETITEFVAYNLEFNPDWELVEVEEIIQQLR